MNHQLLQSRAIAVNREPIRHYHEMHRTDGHTEALAGTQGESSQPRVNELRYIVPSFVEYHAEDFAAVIQDPVF